MPKISVIVPNYNHARFLRQRLDSVYNQTFTDIEVILLDDASTDNSVAILEEYAQQPNTRLFVNETNSGSPFKQWNKGVGLAEGEFVWIAESDDVADPAYLQKAMDMFEGHPASGLFFCRSRLIDADGVLGGLSLLDMSEEKGNCSWNMDGGTFVRKHMMRLNTITNASGVVFRKSLFVDAGLAPTDWLFCGDWLFWCRLCALTRVVYVPDCLNYHRLHQGGLTMNVEVKERRLFESYRVRSVLFQEFRCAWITRQRVWGKLARIVAHEYRLLWATSARPPFALVSFDKLLPLRIAVLRIMVRIRMRAEL